MRPFEVPVRIISIALVVFAAFSVLSPRTSFPQDRGDLKRDIQRIVLRAKQLKSEGRDISDLRPLLAKLKEAYRAGRLDEAGNLLKKAKGILARIEGSEGEPPGKPEGEDQGRKDFRWEAFRDKGKEWFGGPEAVRIADNVLSFQMEHGGWSKGIDMVSHARAEGERISVYHKDLGTFDNGQTTSQMRFLAAVHIATGMDRFKQGFVKGLEYVFKAQYPSGGFPQVFQQRGNYSDHVTFNDGAMQNVLALLKEMVERAEYGFAGEDARKKAKVSLDRGIDYILESQIEVNGVPTGWCQQHDPVTFEAKPGRKHEPADLSAAETASIVLLLRSLNDKPARVVRSIDAAVEWLKAVKLEGVKAVRTAKVLEVRTGVPGAHCWARFYEIGTNRPVFCGRDGVVKYSIEEIDPSFRARYAWYGNWGDLVLGKEQTPREKAVKETKEPSEKEPR